MIVLFNSGGCSATNCSISCWHGLSVNESRRELFAVEVAVLAFPPVLSVMPPPFGVITAAELGSGDLDRIEGPSWIDGKPCNNRFLYIAIK